MEPTAGLTGALTAAGARRGRFRGLDGLRAVAAMLVVVFHTAGSVAPFSTRAGGTVLVRFGNWGVAIFFLLSGFLLYRPFVDTWLSDRPPPDLRTYLTRRLARIVPAYWVALTVLLFLVRDAPPAGGLADYGLFYGFAQTYRSGYVDRGGGLSVAWTLCIEMSFYLALPALAWGMRRVASAGAPVAERVRHQLTAIAVVALASVALRWWLLRAYPLAAFWLPSYLGWFGLGLAGAVLHVHRERGGGLSSALAWLGRHAELCWIAGVGIFLLTTRMPVRFPTQTRIELMVIFVGNGLSAALLLLPLLFGDLRQGPVRSVLESRPLAWLGGVSYGIYLWHTIWLVVIVRWAADGRLAGGFWLRLLVVCVMTLAAAVASATLVERPIIDLAQRWPHRRRASVTRG